MAEDWIKMRTNLADDPRILGVCTATKTDEAKVIGCLYLLWAMADKHTSDGVLVGLTLCALDRKVSLPGFGQALCAIRWLAEFDGGLRVLKFEDHNGASAKTRCQTAKRVAKHSKKQAERLANAVSVSESLGVRYQEQEQEEERSKEKEPNGSLSEVLQTSDPAPAQIDPSKAKAEARAKMEAERLAQVTAEAIQTFNASPLVKPNRGLLATVNAGVGRKRRQANIKRITGVAREICRANYESEKILPEFWVDYWQICASDDFLSGRRGGGKEHESWMPDFEFLTRPKTMLKVYDRTEGEQ